MSSTPPDPAPGAVGPTAGSTGPSGAAAPGVRGLSCPSCGGGMHFDPGSSGLKCPQCGAIREIASSPTPRWRPFDPDAVSSGAEASLSPRPEGDSPDAGPDQELLCPNCGGRAGFVGTLTATRCPYCGSPVQRTDIRTASGRLPVDAIVPFALSEDQAREHLHGTMHKIWLAPKAFRNLHTSDAFAAVYLPFFVFDIDTRTYYEGQAGELGGMTGEWKPLPDHPYRRGEIERRFENVSILAESSIAKRDLGYLEPWPVATALAFRPEFIAGCLCRAYERDLHACWAPVNEQVESDIGRELRIAIQGHPRIDKRETTYQRSYRQILLPVYLCTVPYRGEVRHFYVNGSSGNVMGSAPTSKPKAVLAIGTILLVIALFLSLLVLGD